MRFIFLRDPKHRQFLSGSVNLTRRQPTRTLSFDCVPSANGKWKPIYKHAAVGGEQKRRAGKGLKSSAPTGVGWRANERNKESASRLSIKAWVNAADSFQLGQLSKGLCLIPFIGRPSAAYTRQFGVAFVRRPRGTFLNGVFLFNMCPFVSWLVIDVVRLLQGVR